MEEIASIIPRALRQHVKGGNPPVLEILVPLWRAIAGKYIGQCSRPVAYEEGMLTLAVISPSWETQLRGFSEPLTAHINNFFGVRVIRKLRIRPHSLKDQGAWAPAGPGGEIPAKPVLNADLISSLKIKDELRLPEELVGVVERSYVKYFSRPMKRNLQ
ncbi:MAG: DUF721 domain-containing protein [Acidobacteriota bacterium]|nr:DUF721 domain-containing protein [Acidobacteriota bacterium]